MTEPCKQTSTATLKKKLFNDVLQSVNNIRLQMYEY